MVTHVVEQDSKITLYANFVKQDGTAATLTDTPQIRIQHVEDGNVITDLAATNMTNITGSRYFYTHYFNRKAKITTYLATYTVTYSGPLSVIGTDEIEVVEKGGLSSKTGGHTSKITMPALTKEEKDRLIEAVTRTEAIVGSTKPTDLSPLLEEIKAIRSNPELVANLERIKEDVKAHRKELMREVAYIKSTQRELKESVSSKNEENVAKVLSQVEKKTDTLMRALVKVLSDEDLEVLANEGLDTN